jgi:hypothetical protein
MVKIPTQKVNIIFSLVVDGSVRISVSYNLNGKS